VDLQTAKIGSLVDIQDSEDPEGLRIFYYLVQDLRVRACPYFPSPSVAYRFFMLVLHLFLDFFTLQNQAHLIARLTPKSAIRSMANVNVSFFTIVFLFWADR
jgi:hypothetical protein